MSDLRMPALLLSLLCLAGCTSSNARPGAPDAATQLQSIPAAQPDKLKDVKGWSNPYLIVRTDGVALLDMTNQEEKVYKPQELPQVLAALPASSWPLGRVVAVTVRPSDDSEQQKAQLRENRALVAGTLQQLKIYVNWINSK
jgi:hypothetical protein